MRFFVLCHVCLACLASGACSRAPSEPPPSPEVTHAAPAAGSASGAAGASSAPGASGAPTTSGAPGAGIVWDDPPRWKRRAPSTPMRKAEYLVPRAGKDADDAECFVITFGNGQGGSIDDNIERWVKQLQPTTSPVERTKRTAHGWSVTRVEVAGTYTPMQMPGAPSSGGGPHAGSRLVGEIVESPAGMWFFKMTGPDATVKAAGKELDALVDSVRPG